MSRNSLNFAFQRMAEEVIPNHLQLKDFGGVKLHPLIREEGGFDNDKTIFGLIIPASHAKSLIIQVSEATEKAIKEESAKAIQLLKADLKQAISLWDARALPHEHALKGVVKL